MPLLGELIDSVETFISEHQLPRIIYNIEFKTSPRYDSLGYNAPPGELVDAVMEVINSKGIGNRFTYNLLMSGHCSLFIKNIQEFRLAS